MLLSSLVFPFVPTPASKNEVGAKEERRGNMSTP